MSLINDFRLAWRTLFRQPGFSLVVILTLALTTGATTTVFTLFDAVVLRPFPYPNSERLVRLQTEEPNVAGTKRESSITDFYDWRRENSSFAEMGEYVRFANNLTGRGPAIAARMTFATPGTFRALQVQPLMGRLYTDAEDQYGGDVRKVVMNHSMYRQLFGDRSDGLNSLIQLRGAAYTVIGVMPPGFDFPDRTQVWVPLMARYTASPYVWWKNRDIRIHSVLARLKDGVTLEQAQANMSAIAASIESQNPVSNKNIHVSVRPFRDVETGSVRPYVLAVAGGVLLLLLIGCVNVANLFIARAVARERELAIRSALGSSSWRLVRQLLAESVLYGLIGGAAGMTLAYAGQVGLTRLIPVDLPSWMRLSIDLRVAFFCIAISLLTAVLFGLAPAIHHWRPDLNEVLKSGTKGSSGGQGVAKLLRSGLVVLEVALSLILLAAAGLMLHSFARLQKVDTGLKTDHLIVAKSGRFVAGSDRLGLINDYSKEIRRICDRLSEIPGVSVAAATDDVPLVDKPEQRSSANFYTRRRATRDLAYRGLAHGADVTPGFFAALGISILEGRDFTEADDSTQKMRIVIGKHVADVLFPGESSLGQQIRWDDGTDEAQWLTVIGVAGDTKWQPAEREKGFEVYWSYRQYPTPGTSFLVRTTVPPERIIPLIQRTIQETNPDFSVETVRSMDTIADAAVWQRRLWGFLLAAFAALALALSAVGIYGVISYLVSQRTREVGIRMAIGASAGDILKLVMGQGFRLVGIGMGIGLVGSILTGRLMQSLLFGVSPSDPATLALVALTLFAAAVFATGIPAIRAARLDPNVALRDE